MTIVSTSYSSRVTTSDSSMFFSLKKKKKEKTKIHSTRQAQLVHHGYLGSHKADPVGFG